MKKCPYCQGEVEDDATICKHCGRGRTSAVRAASGATADERCPYCAAAVNRTDKECPHCQRRLTGKALLENPPPAFPGGSASQQVVVQRVAVVDVDMPFGSMVTFMVKWSLAAIPALLILLAVAFVVGLLFGGIGAALIPRR
jgi:predicted amidophosphoribosyltransferase